MAADKINNILIPNVTRLRGQNSVDLSNKLDKTVKPDEFKNLLDEQLKSDAAKKSEEGGISLSVHAARRLKERNLSIEGAEYFKLKDAFNALKEKGGQDSLVITGQAAYIVDVKNSKIVTALDKSDMGGNVFTKIDSTIIMN